MSTMESRNLVRSRTFTILLPLQLSTDELIAYTVHRPEVHWIGRFFLQFLPKLQDMVVNGPGGRIIVISPDLVEQFVASNDALGILHHELQGLEFLRSEGDGLTFAEHFHLAEVNEDLVECEFLGR